MILKGFEFRGCFSNGFIKLFLLGLRCFEAFIVLDLKLAEKLTLLDKTSLFRASTKPVSGFFDSNSDFKKFL